ncbi:polysaccharide pyruvyl transferase family protein [Tenacibaculum sp. 190524A02b]|uniref:polysaccharide pyruvyl transferase family protein n=1 Tax=Tenacibaculum vairaonense TaxID=3137860 RepID=UPI0031FB5B62
MLEIKNKTILLFGYYGKSNIGDDIMLKNLTEILVTKKAKKIVVLVDKSFDLEENFYTNIIFLKGLKKNFFRFLYFLVKLDYFIWGGGTCFFDNPSISGLKELLYFTKIRKKFSESRKNFFIGIGVEKVNNNREIIIKILDNTDGIILRDQKSFENLINLYPSISKKLDFTEVFNDMVLMNATNEIIKKDSKEKEKSNKSYITFSGHYKYENNNDVIQHCATELEKILDRLNINVLVFIPAKYDINGDSNFHYKIKKTLQSSEKYILETPILSNYKDYMQTLSKSQKHIGMRLHSLILSDILMVPNIALAYQEKIKQYNENAFKILDKWGEEEFLLKNEEEITNTLLNNSKLYENFFK